MFSNGHHYSTNFNQAQSQQSPSEPRAYAHLQSSSQSLHRGNQSQNQGYPSPVYSSQQHYGPTSSLSVESSAKYDYRWGDGTHTNIAGQTPQSRDQSVSHHTSRAQETPSARSRVESSYDTRGLGSLAYASGLDVAALNTHRPVSTGTANYTIPATTAPDSYRRDPPALGSVSSASESTISHQPPLPSSNSPYANGSIAYSQPPRGPHNLPSIHQTYSISDMGNTPSTKQGANQHVLSNSGSEGREYTGSRSKEFGSEQIQNDSSIHHSDTSPSYQGYRPSQSTSSIQQGRSNSITEYPLQHHQRASQMISNKTRTSESPYSAPLPSKSPDQHNIVGTARYNQPVRNGAGRSDVATTTLEPRTASPFHVRQYQAHHGRSSPLIQARTTQDRSSHGTVTATIPTTVDPSQVYNPQHEYRRQAAAAEAKAAERSVRQVEDVVAPSLATGNASSAGRSAPTDNQQQTATRSVVGSPETPAHNEGAAIHAGAAAHITPTLSEAHPAENQEDMESQMRIMVEKMRKYQAMDPTKFAKVWEEVKKGPSQTGTPTQSGFQQSSAGPRLSTASAESMKSPSGQSSDLNTTTSPTLPVSAQQGLSMQTQTQKAVLLGQTSDMNVTPSHVSPAEAQRDMLTNGQTPKGKMSTKEEALPASARKSKSKSKTSAPPVNDNSTRQIQAPKAARGVPGPETQLALTSTNASNLQPPRAGTHWPESKKAALSRAAVKTLKSIPGNADKSIDTEFINGILDRNPSYIELCQILENLGFTLDRARFAKSLLAAVPDTSPGTRKPTLHQPQEVRPISSVEAEVHQPEAGPAREPASLTHSVPKTTNASGNDATQKERKGARKSTGRTPGRPRKDGTPAQPRIKVGGASPSHPQNTSTSSQNTVLATPVPAGQRSDDLMLTGQTTRHGDVSSAGLGSAKEQDRLVSQQVLAETPATSQGSAVLMQKKKPLESGNRTNTKAGQVDSNTLPDTQLNTPSKTGHLVGSKAVQVSSKAMTDAAPQLNNPSDMCSSAKKEADQVASKTKPDDPKRRSTLNALEHASPSNGNVVAASLSTSTPAQRQTHTIPAGKSQDVPQVRTMSKAEAARKRSFAEIVDLTEISDDEIYSGRMAKRLHTNGQIGTSRTAGPTPQGNSPFQGNEQAHSNESAAQSTGNGLSPFSTIRTARHSLSGRELVRSVRKEHALRRSTYDSRTIARDVLIASGRHPRMRGLNEHLDLLKQNFPSVTNLSDLSTFRWDLVDPEAPTSGTGELHEADKQSVRKNRVQEISGITGDDISTGMRDVQTLQPQRAPKDRGIVKDPAEFSNAVGDVSAASASLSKISTKTSLTLSQKRPREPESEFDSGFLPRTSPSDGQPVHKRIRISPASHNNASDLAASRGSTSSSHPLKGSSIGLRRSSRAVGQSTAKKSQSRKAKSLKKTGKTRNPPRRSPRNLSSSFAVVIHNKGTGPASAKSSGRKTAGLQAASDSEDDWEPIPMPVYKCLWTNCPAELHNIDVLRQHVMKLHKPPAAHRTFHCSWQGCTKVVKDKNNSDVPIHQPYLFGSEEDWFEHVNRQHIEEYGWKYGDGPFAGPIVDDSDDPDDPSWCKDAMGRRIFPKPSELLSTTYRTAVGRGCLPNAAWFRAHGLRTAEQRGQAIIDSISETQRRSDNTGHDIGATVCRGGPTFVTPALQRSLVAEYHTEIVDRV